MEILGADKGQVGGGSTTDHLASAQTLTGAGLVQVFPGEVTWLWLCTRGNFHLAPPRRSRSRALKLADPDQLMCA
eukprot:2089143-Rhodomonas_salina.3